MALIVRCTASPPSRASVSAPAASRRVSSTLRPTWSADAAISSIVTEVSSTADPSRSAFSAVASIDRPICEIELLVWSTEVASEAALSATVVICAAISSMELDVSSAAATCASTVPLNLSDDASI